MLILTRRMGESLIIDDDIKIKVLSIKGRQVRIGIDAPKEVAVHREEIYKRIQQEQGNGYPEEGQGNQEQEQEQEQKYDDVDSPQAIVG